MSNVATSFKYVHFSHFLRWQRSLPVRIELLRLLLQMCHELVVEVEYFDFRGKRIRVVNVCHPKTSLLVIVVDQCQRHRTARSEIRVVVVAQVVRLLVQWVYQVESIALVQDKVDVIACAWYLFQVKRV